MACILKVTNRIYGSDAWLASLLLLRGAESTAVPPHPHLSCLFLALIFFLFLWQMHMEGDLETCSWHGFSSHHSCLLAPALKELQTVGSRGEKGCVPNNGDTLDEGYLLTAAFPVLECAVAPLGPPVPAQPPLLDVRLVLLATAPDLWCVETPLSRRP